MAGWRASPGRSAVCCVPEPKGTAAARSSEPGPQRCCNGYGLTATSRLTPGAATADANLSLPPTDAQRRHDWSGTVGRGLADAIVAALFDSGDSLAERCR